MTSPLYLSRYENEITYDTVTGEMIYAVRVWYEAAYDKFVYFYSKNSHQAEGVYIVHKHEEHLAL